MTLPTASNTATYTFSLPTGTETFSDTGTFSKEAYTNFTMLMAPAEFVEGQEVRLLIGTILEGVQQKLLRYNVSDKGDTNYKTSLSVAVVKFSSVYATDCEKYFASDATADILQRYDRFGVEYDVKMAGEIYVAQGYVTVTTPLRHHGEWLICFKHHTTPASKWKIPDPLRDKWTVFITSVGTHADDTIPMYTQAQLGRYVFTSPAAGLYYHLPEATEGQYAVMQLLASNGMNFTYTSSRCGRGDLQQCALGDNLKIVPEGSPCTVERTGFNLYKSYLGSRYVRTTGEWEPHAYRGIIEGATQGGVGRMGTQYANPSVDTWTAAGSAYDANNDDMRKETPYPRTVHPPGGEQSHSYAYVRLPLTPGARFEVCFSSLAQRQATALQNNSALQNIPLWGKLARCSNPHSCGSATSLSFEVLNETVAWSMNDLTPGTWGSILFHDISTKLNSYPAGGMRDLASPVEAPTDSAATPVDSPLQGVYPVPNAFNRIDNYWAPQGGDYFRIVRMKDSSFEEERTESFPSVGCWSRELDGRSYYTQGGFSDEGAYRPIGSFDLHDDPTKDMSTRRDDHVNQSLAFSTLYLPEAGSSWMVCYRKTCGHESGGYAVCAKHAGMRVLPYFDPSQADLPSLRRWGSALKDYHRMPGFFYGRTYGGNPMALLPGKHPTKQNSTYPPRVVWHMNDTREGTWGPLLIEISHPSEITSESLDSRQWNYDKLANSADVWNDVKGSVVRLVPWQYSCDYLRVHDVLGAESRKGGLIECNSAEAYKMNVSLCYATQANLSRSTSLAFYIMTPAVGEKYRVCFRLHSWNWVEVSEAISPAWLPEHPSYARERDVISLTTNFFIATNPPTITAEVHDSQTLSELLFLIKDSSTALSTARRGSCTPGSNPLLTSLCESTSGDVFRIVPSAPPHHDPRYSLPGPSSCEINPFTYDVNLIDDSLSLYCEAEGSGERNRSGLSHRVCGDTQFARKVCGGKSCNATTDVGETELLAFLQDSHAGGDVYDDILPYDTTQYDAAGVAAFVTPPPHLANRTVILCYKQAHLANWVIFNNSMKLEPDARFSVSYPMYNVNSPGRGGGGGGGGGGAGSVLLGGMLQKFVVRFPYNISSIGNATLANSVVNDNSGGSVVSGILPKGFRAKLVKASKNGNDGCMNPAGDTPSIPFGSFTTRYVVEKRNELIFHLSVPQSSGQYHLCLQIQENVGSSARNSGRSWWRPNPYSYSYLVRENGVRWYATTGNHPTNNGVSTVQLVKCSPTDFFVNITDHPECTFGPSNTNAESSSEVFSTNPGEDAVKLIAFNDSCSGAVFSESFWGPSEHVGVEGGGVNGISNLGPADGPIDVASFTSAHPPSSVDAAVQFKLCVKTSYVFDSVAGFVFTSSPGSVQRRVWVEVAQHDIQSHHFDSQIQILNEYNRRPAYSTKPSLIKSWSVSDSIAPINSMISHQGDTALSGASTVYVSNPAANSPFHSVGFWFNTFLPTHLPGRVMNGSYGIHEGNRFKLVAAKNPNKANGNPDWANSRWGDASLWDDVNYVAESCYGESAPSATNLESCVQVDHTTGLCANLSASDSRVFATFHIPITNAAYFVCYQIIGADPTNPNPWLLLPSDSGGYHVFAHPAFLSVKSDYSKTNLSVFDLAVSNASESTASSVSTWCASSGTENITEGFDCQGENMGFSNDLISIVNGSQVCTVPTIAPTGGSAWWGLYTVFNTTAKVADNGVSFALPPTLPDPSGRYKICVYKAGDGAGYNSSSHISRQGVVYQVWNGGALSTGGGSAYWRDFNSDMTPDRIDVTHGVEVNTTAQFVEYLGNNVTQNSYINITAAEVTDPTTQQTSHTPLVRTGSKVRFFLQLQSSTAEAFPFGNNAVEVGKCITTLSGSHPFGSFAHLACDQVLWPGDSTANLLDRHLFDIIGEKASATGAGSCSAAEGKHFGWDFAGLRQYMAEGGVWLDITYNGVCPETHFGCGVRFRTTHKGVYLYSNPQWLNVQRNTPDGLMFDGVLEETAVGPKKMDVSNTFVMVCDHEGTCYVNIVPLFKGPREFAPNGTVSIRYSTFDYTAGGEGLVTPIEVANGVNAARFHIAESQQMEWSGGAFQYSAVPVLAVDVPYYYDVFMQAVADSGASRVVRRFAIRTERPYPTAVTAHFIQNLDTVLLPGTQSYNKEPAPVVHTSSNLNHLTAEVGSYLEALSPYRFVFSLNSDSSDKQRGTRTIKTANIGAIGGWVLSGTVSSINSESNMVLAVLTSTELYGNASSEKYTSEGNLADTPNEVSAILKGVAPKAAFESTSEAPLQTTAFCVDFRILNNIGCSRFEQSGGCTISFFFENPQIPIGTPDTIHGGRLIQRRLEMKLTIPVRVVASTLKVFTSTQISPARDAIEVIAVPGTPCYGLSYDGSANVGNCFLPDEFHTGNIFANFGAPYPNMRAGMQGRDGVLLEHLVPHDACIHADQTGCLVPAFMPRRTAVDPRTFPSIYDVNAIIGAASASIWGARMRLRTDQPCYLCEFTFHSSSGAGPDSYFGVINGVVSDPSEVQHYGTTTLTYAEEPISMLCEADVSEVYFGPNALRSSYFSVAVNAVSGPKGVSAGYPRWWVSLDTTEITVVSPPRSLRRYYLEEFQTPQVKSLRRTFSQQMGSGAGTVFRSLYFESSNGTGGIPVAGSPEVRRIVIRAVGPTYSSRAPGSLLEATQRRSCTIEISLLQGVPSQKIPNLGRSRLKVVSVGNGVSLCTTPGDCNKWEISTTSLALGVGIECKIVTTHNRGDATLRNITIIPEGGSLSTPLFTTTLASSSNIKYIRETTPLEMPLNATRGVFISTPVHLDSPYNDDPDLIAENSRIDRKVGLLTYGNATVVFERTATTREGRISDISEAGTGVVQIRYSSTLPADHTPIRNAVVKLCGLLSLADGSETIELDLCDTLHLWVRPPTLATELLILHEDPVVTQITGGGPPSRYCINSPATLLTFDVMSVFAVVAHSLKTVRFVGYGTPLEYSLSANGQQFNEPGSFYTNTTTSFADKIPLAMRVAHNLSFSALVTQIAVHGRMPSAATQLSLSASPRHSSGASPSTIRSTANYTFVLPSDVVKDFASWEISPFVTMDEECPLKRHFSSLHDGYRTFKHRPGASWSYLNDAYVGLPFPIQTVVLDAKGGRAWGFEDGVFVKVTKYSHSGCNDGGGVTIYRLPTTATALSGLSVIEGDVASFEKGGWGGSAVPSVGGMALVWPVFDAPCASCTLQLELCFSTATSLETCLDHKGSSRASDVAPLYSQRIRLSRPFSVRPPKVTSLAVSQQTVPLLDTLQGRVEVQTGRMFSIVFTKVLEIRSKNESWVLNPYNTMTEGYLDSSTTPPVMLEVSTIWVDGEAAMQSAAALRYGNGGFIHSGTMSSCSVPSEHLYPEHQRKRSALGVANWPEVNFYFIRPCSGCVVQIRYQVTAGAEIRSFLLRDFERFIDSVGVDTAPPRLSAPLTMRVRVCGVKWVFAGRPHPAIRRRKKFSVSLLWADRNNFPMWGGGVPATLQFNRPHSSGNGAGGGGSPLFDLTPGAVATGMEVEVAQPSLGSATFMFMLPRACFRCKLSVKGVGVTNAHEFTVLTDPTRFVVSPLSMVASRKVMTSATDTASWGFTMYAADEAGDRAYTLGGPGMALFQPLYCDHASYQGVLLKVKVSPERTYSVLSTDLLVTSVTTGVPTVRVTNGTTLTDGVPQGAFFRESTPSGEIAVELSRKAAVNFVVEFALDGAWSVYGSKLVVQGQSFRTVVEGSDAAPAVDFSLLPTHMVVQNPATNLCGKNSVGGSCTFSAIAVAKGFSALGEYTVASFEGGSFVGATTASAVSVCVPATCVARVQPTAVFVRGIANFSIAFDYADVGVDCACTVTVSPPQILKGTDQSFALSFNGDMRESSGGWDWHVLTEVEVLELQSGVNGTNDSLIASVAPYVKTDVISTTSSTTDRLVRLYIRNSVPLSDATLITWQAPHIWVDAAQMTPPDCFACSSSAGARCAVTILSSTTIFVEGVFTQKGLCIINKAAILGLATTSASGGAPTQPTQINSAASPRTTLKVTVKTTTSVETTNVFTPSTSGGAYNAFGNLHGSITVSGRTLPCAVLEGPVKTAAPYLRFDAKQMHPSTEVVTHQSGEHHVTVTVTPMQEGPGGLTALSMAELAKWGELSCITKEGVCRVDLPVFAPTTIPAAGGVAESFAPYYFTGTAVVQQYNRSLGTHSAQQIAVFPPIGPLHVVRGADTLKLERFVNGNWTEVYSDGGSTISTAVGRAVVLRVSAVFSGTGEVVSAVGEKGSAAEVSLRAQSVPCVDVDATELASSCVHMGTCARKVFAELPSCGSLDWNISTTELRLLNGIATLPPLHYTSHHTGVVPVTIATTSLSFSGEVFTKTFDFFLQKVSSIVIVGTAAGGIVCDAKGGSVRKYVYFFEKKKMVTTIIKQM